MRHTIFDNSTFIESKNEQNYVIYLIFLIITKDALLDFEYWHEIYIRNITISNNHPDDLIFYMQNIFNLIEVKNLTFINNSVKNAGKFKRINKKLPSLNIIQFKTIDLSVIR